MRIRVRVTAPVEMLSYVRRTNGRPIRTGAEPKIAVETAEEEKTVAWSGTSPVFENGQAWREKLRSRIAQDAF